MMLDKNLGADLLTFRMQVNHENQDNQMQNSKISKPMVVCATSAMLSDVPACSPVRSRFANPCHHKGIDDDETRHDLGFIIYGYKSSSPSITL